MIELVVINTQDSIAKCAAAIASEVAEGKPIRVKISKIGKRSLSQNGLYWMWCEEVANQAGYRLGDSYSKDDAHAFFKSKFCPQKITRFGPEAIPERSTAKLDVGEMTFYLNQIEQWAVSLGFALTIPDDCEYKNLMRSQYE